MSFCQTMLINAIYDKQMYITPADGSQQLISAEKQHFRRPSRGPSNSYFPSFL
jgi:hypothetical protein